MNQALRWIAKGARALAVCLIASMPQLVSAANVDPELQAVLDKVVARMPRLANATPVRSPVPGIIELRYDDGVLYASADGRYVFGGPLLDMRTRRNLTEDYDKERRVTTLSTVSERQMIVFEPKGAVKHTITTFTDIDCGYCRKLHGEMAAMNGRGIRVRYMLYPRAGIGSDAHRKAVAVWCADDSLAAMTDAKAGRDPGSKSCSNPVEAHLELGRKLGLRGTPFTITESGETINGYLPPTALLERLATMSR